MKRILTALTCAFVCFCKENKSMPPCKSTFYPLARIRKEFLCIGYAQSWGSPWSFIIQVSGLKEELYFRGLRSPAPTFSLELPSKEATPCFYLSLLHP